jgi:hypothetical protein
MKNMLDARPIVSLAMMAAISKAQVIISISAKVPNMDLGVPFILQAYCGNLLKLAEINSGLLPVEIAFVLVAFSTGAIKSIRIRSIR